ncbi:MAG: ABC transporter substrate-binding protein, partial [Actinomycetota bacterium]|nr:ABC transporter substrate-binding protein [Actinomycetota bacterium]
MKVFRARCIALGLICVALAACNGDEPTARKNTCRVVLGAMGDLTPQTGSGIDMFRGVELAIEEARSRGRLDCDVELQIEDTQGDPELASDHARAMVKNDDLLACLCGYTNEEALAAAPVMSGAGILISGPAASPAIPEQGFATWFSAAPTDEVEAAATIDYINSLGAIEGLAVIDDGSELGTTMADRIATPLGELIKSRLSEDSDDVAVELEDSQLPLIYVGAATGQAGEIAGRLR